MDARKRLIIIKGKDQTDSVASFQFRDGKCEVVYTSAPNKTYSFQSGNVEILPLQKKIDPAQVIVTANEQTIGGIDELLDFGGYYRIVRDGKKDLSFCRNEVQFQQNCLTDGKNQEAFQYFKETAAAISLEVEGINILSMQYDKIKQVSEDTVLASYLAPRKEVRAPQMPEAVIYPFGLNQSQKLAVERALSSKISIIQGPPGTGKTQTILNIIANVIRSGKTVAVVSNNNSATHNVAEKLEKKNAVFLTAFLGSLANKQKFLEAQTGAYPDMSDWEIPPEKRQQLDQETTALSKELNEMLNAKNRIAEIEQEFLRLNPEQHYFEEYYATYPNIEELKLGVITQLSIDDQIKNQTKLSYISGTANESLPSSHNGLGYKNLIKMEFLLAAFAKDVEKRGVACVPLLFIEEPESHMHPQMQTAFATYLEKFLGKLSTVQIQTFLTSHSAHIANTMEFAKVRYAQKSNAGVIYKNLNTFARANPENVDFIRKYLTLTKCDLFFADKAIFVEGASERLLLPDMIEKCETAGVFGSCKYPLSAQYYALIEIGGAYAHKFIPFIDFLGVPCLILTDLDSVADRVGESGKVVKKSVVVSQGETTSNETIKWWVRRNNGLPECDTSKIDLTEITSMTTANKTRGKCHIVFQTAERGLCGHSLEEAIRNVNRTHYDLGDSISEEDLEFKGKSKTDFALDLICECSGYCVPDYIKSGLKWLNDQRVLE